MGSSFVGIKLMIDHSSQYGNKPGRFVIVFSSERILGLSVQVVDLRFKSTEQSVLKTHP